MHDDRALIEARIRRELWERVLPLVHRDHRSLTLQSGADREHLAPFVIGERWGTPWGTTWFRADGVIPESWSHRRVEAVLDLGFHPDATGFQCEGLIVDERGRPQHGIHPRRMTHRVESRPGPVTIWLEAASNPSFPQFRPSSLGDPDARDPDGPLLYRVRRAELVLVDPEAEALVHDLDVADGVMRTLGETDPRRARLRAAIVASLDAIPDVVAARRALTPALALPARASAHRIVATGHAHLDTAWLWPIDETVRKCTRTFASAVQLLDEEPDHVFSCSQAQQYAWIEERHPELFEQITRHIATGRWVPVGGMWVESDMNLPSGESLVRQIVLGQRYFQDRFGVRCTEMWIPDVFGYPASLPQVFAAGGLRRFVTQKLSWNTQNRFPHHTFWWEGLDGTRVLSHFPPVDTYNAEINPAEVAHASARFAEHAWSDWSLMPFGYGDGGGGPTREMLERARRLRDLDGSATVEIASPAAFFERVEHELRHGASAPVWRGELYFEMHRGTLTSQIRTKLGNRRCEQLLREVELWAATAGVPAQVEHLWQEVLTQQFHDILPGSSIGWVHADAEAVHARVAADLEARIEELLDTLSPSRPTLANTTTHHRDEILTVDPAVAEVVTSGGDAHEPVGLQQLADGRVAMRVTAAGTALSELVPQPIEDRVVVTERSMINRRLAVRWDDHGSLISIIDLRAAREVLRSNAGLTLAADHPVQYDAWDVESWTLVNGRRIGPEVGSVEDIVVLDHGPLVGRVRVQYRVGPSSMSITYVLQAGSERLDCEIDVDWQHDEHLLSMMFPLDLRAETGSCDIQFGVVSRPTHASSSWDAAKFEVCAHRYVDLTEPGFGIAILNDGRWGHGLMDESVRVTLLRAARYPDPNADRGSHQVRLAVLPHAGDPAMVARAAEAFTRPLRVTSGTAASLPDPVVHLDGEGVEIDALKPADDGSGDLIVRFHEHIGARRAVTLSCPHRQITFASRCDLLEVPLPDGGLEVSDGIASLAVRPFEIVTLRVRR